MHLAMEVVGWFGAAAVLLAYGLVSTHRARGDSYGYQSLNIAGAAALFANTAYQGAYPSSFVNAIWIGIGIFALWRRGEKAPPGKAVQS
jgi:hypothetical protein